MGPGAQKQIPISSISLTRLPEAATISPEWLTWVLRDGEWIASSASVLAVEVEPIGSGYGFMSDVARLRLRCTQEDGSAPASIIAKALPTDPALRQDTFEGFLAELRFYAELAAKVPLRTPRLYWGHADSASQQGLLLLEDFSFARSGNQVAGCSVAEAEAVMRELARFHAAGAVPEAWSRHPWLPAAREEPSPEDARACRAKLCGPKGDALAQRIPSGLTDLAKAWLEHSSDPRLLVRGPRTLLHGDVRPDNLFLGVDDHPLSLGFIDWQLVQLGPGVLDVAYFLALSLDADDRRDSEKNLLHAYFDELTRTDQPEAYPFEALWADYRKSLLAIVVRLVAVGMAFSFDGERDSHLFRSAFGRLGRVATDHQLDQVLKEALRR